MEICWRLKRELVSYHPHCGWLDRKRERYPSYLGMEHCADTKTSCGEWHEIWK